MVIEYFVTVHHKDKDVLEKIYSVDIGTLKIYASKDGRNIWPIDKHFQEDMNAFENAGADTSKELSFTYDKQLSDTLLLLEKLTTEETRVVDWYLSSKENKMLLIKQFSDFISRSKLLLELS